MANTDSTEPLIPKILSEEAVNKRRDLLVQRLKERDDIEAKKGSQNKKWNEQLRLLDEQISSIATEVRERKALVPAQMAFGDDPHAEPAPGVTPAKGSKSKSSAIKASDVNKAAKKKRASRKLSAAPAPPNGAA